MALGWIAFSVTDRCQLQCRHCLRDPPRKPTDLDPALMDRVLTQARRLYRCEHVGLTGGEPTLHPALAELLAVIAAHDQSWHLVTNGQALERSLFPLLEQTPDWRQRLREVDISLEGASEQINDRLRGAGSYRAAMRTVARCHQQGIAFSLQMTLNALNAHELEPFALMASHLSAKQVSFGVVQPSGTAADAELFLDHHRCAALRDQVQRLNEALHLPVNYNEGFPSAQPFHCCPSFRGDMLHVDVHGQLTLCCQLSGTAGSGAHQPDVIADLARLPLGRAHALLLERVHALQQAKLGALEAEQLDQAWDLVPCNYCLAQHQRPHWGEGGALGPRAQQARRQAGRAQRAAGDETGSTPAKRPR